MNWLMSYVQYYNQMCNGIPTPSHLYPEVGKITIIIATTTTLLTIPREEKVEDGTNVNTKITEALHGM